MYSGVTFETGLIPASTLAISHSLEFSLMRLLAAIAAACCVSPRCLSASFSRRDCSTDTLIAERILQCFELCLSEVFGTPLFQCSTFTGVFTNLSGVVPLPFNLIGGVPFRIPSSTRTGLLRICSILRTGYSSSDTTRYRALARVHTLTDAVVWVGGKHYTTLLRSNYDKAPCRASALSA